MTKMTIDLSAAAEFLQQHTRPGQRLLCAVSGGLDSMCLLVFLRHWAEENQRTVCAAHFNHQLRGAESDRDEGFVRNWCEAQGIPCVVGTGDVETYAKEQEVSIEEAARKLRYDFLKETAEREGCAWVLTAHHADDNAETMLLNLIRGTGLTGLCGIPQKRDGILRPFLQIPRTELEAYAERNNILHVEDATNSEPDVADRNRLRLQIMPLLKELNPRAVEHMAQTSRHLRSVDTALEAEARDRIAQLEVRNGRVTVEIQELKAASDSIRPRMLLQMFDLLGVGRKDIGAVHLNAIWSLCESAGNREGQLSLPHGVTARCNRGWLSLERRLQTLVETELAENCPIHWGDYTLTLLDHREGEGIVLRERTKSERPVVTVGPCPVGQRLTLPGAKGSRSVKRLCVDRGIDLKERDALPAIYAGGKLAAVWRLGVNEEFLPEGNSCRFIQIRKRNEKENHNEE